MADAVDLQARIAALQAARDAIDREIALLSDGAAAPPLSIGDPDWVNLATAAHRCGRHVDSMARIVRARGLGRRVGRDWRVDMNRVRAWQEGRPFPPLPSEIVGHRGESSDVPDDSMEAS